MGNRSANARTKPRDVTTATSTRIPTTTTITTTEQLRFFESPPPSELPLDWSFVVGVSIGALFGAALLISGAVLLYKRWGSGLRLHREATTGVNMYVNSKWTKGPDTYYEDVHRGSRAAPNQPLEEVSIYTDLQHADRAMYDQLKWKQIQNR
ncbi:uncharacterized protein LOC144766562 [Lissotriton helveticus]